MEKHKPKDQAAVELGKMALGHKKTQSPAAIAARKANLEAGRKKRAIKLWGKCRCGEPGTKPHPCPYKLELDGDVETMCNCCDVCRQNCSDDV